MHPYDFYNQLNIIYLLVFKSFDLFYGNKGTTFTNKLSGQRQAVEKQNNIRIDYWRINQFDETTITALNSKINQQLSQLQNIRNQVDEQSISVGKAISYYTETNKLLLSISTLLSEISTDAAVSK
jgi:hypothetical protein